MIELLSPVGDFECLKAAVQNGADAVYFGANTFSARAFASNFDDNSLKEAITYAKLRGVKTHLTLNTLIKDSEMQDAIELAKKAYEYGIDAIIVQDLGLARYLIKNFPGLAIHGSTQMSVHNLEGVLELQKLGFSRVVLSRELSLQEIEYICKNSNIGIEVFVHGALCISYSGQCLFSSMVGGRSGNRGKCAQPCRLSYELLQENSVIDTGYLLSPRDLCGLEYLPQLIKAGVTSLKIEGRMKTPEYVATVTQIYKKYINLAMNQNFKIDNSDKLNLMQVFNRGGFSSGHLENFPNKDLIYKYKSNNMGIYLGKITNFNANKGYITLTLPNDKEILATISVGDKINIENKKHETSLYTISELMINDKNVPIASNGDKIKIGRMKGAIEIGDKIYKIYDKSLSTSSLSTLNKENIKINLNCKISVKKHRPIIITVWNPTNNIDITLTSSIIPIDAINSPITKERLITQISKTNNTPFQFKNIEIDLDDGLYIQGISSINELRRQALSLYEEKVINSFQRDITNIPLYTTNIENTTAPVKEKSISILLNIINKNFDYTKLKNINNVYIPLKYFIKKEFTTIIQYISNKYNTFIYMPTIIRNNYNKLIAQNLSNILKTFNIKGFIVSNIGNIELLKDYKNNYKFISNYTFNVYNSLTIDELNNTNITTITLSPELNKLDLQKLIQHNNSNLELIVYGKTPLMNANYCLLGKSNKCYSSCKHLCSSSTKFYLKDRLGFLFRIIPDNIDTVTTIYNSKITSIEHNDINVNSIRIDILDETIEDINNLIDIIKTGKKLEGKDYTNGNLNKEI